MTENRKLKVFLCHSKDDKPKVHELYRRLVTDGFDVWLDEEKLLPGIDWDLEIRKAVRKTDVVLICLSNGSATKAGYVQKEIRFALDVADEQPEGAIFLIPVKLEECQVPNRLSKLQWVDLFDKYGYKRLKLALSKQASTLGISSHDDGLRPIRVEEEFRRVWVGEKKIHLPTTSFQLFMLLYNKSPNPITYAEISSSANTFPLQEGTIVDREWVRVNITRLKKLLGDDRYIQSERDIGYRLLLNLEDT